MDNTKFITTLITSILLLVAMFSYVSDSISGTEEIPDDKEMEQVLLKISTAAKQIEEFESKHPNGIPPLAQVCASLSSKDMNDITLYYLNCILVKYVKQLSGIASNKKEKADEVIKAYREVFGIAKKIENECKKVGDPFKDFCTSLFEVVAIESAGMAIKAANFCAKVRRLDDARQIYREVIITYTGFIYKSFVKQAEFGLEDLKELEQQHNKKAPKK